MITTKAGKMIKGVDIANVLFFDVECVSAKPNYQELGDDMKDLWKHKSRFLLKHAENRDDEEIVAQTYADRAAIYAEFGKVVCISVGIVFRDTETKKLRLRLKSFSGTDEPSLLTDFSDMLTQYYNDPSKVFLCGHNIKEFDVPYICRRMVIHQIPLPRLLQLHGKKPWETNYLLDTMELWKFGDYKAYSSLKLLTTLLGIPSPKDDIDGSEVGRVFWEDGDVDRIARYCEKDVLATVQLFLKFKYMPLLEDEQITHVNNTD